MKKILIGKTTGLKGSVKIQGGKNAVLPILAASILTEEKVKINNCPDIEDVRQTIKLLEMLGCKVFFVNGTIEVYPKDVEDTRISSEYTRNTRSSILFLGAMLGRLGRIVITKPGGCKIGPVIEVLRKQPLQHGPQNVHHKNMAGLQRLHMPLIERLIVKNLMSQRRLPEDDGADEIFCSIGDDVISPLEYHGLPGDDGLQIQILRKRLAGIGRKKVPAQPRYLHRRRLPQSVGELRVSNMDQTFRQMGVHTQRGPGSP